MDGCWQLEGLFFLGLSLEIAVDSLVSLVPFFVLMEGDAGYLVLLDFCFWLFFYEQPVKFVLPNKTCKLVNL